METHNYTIKTPVFEGPFAILLDLVERRKLFINDMSLAAVTEDYLNYINTLGGLEKVGSDKISSFIVVASTLILIKSKSLLPNLDLTAEEESNIHTLEERLRLYELFSKLSVHVKGNFGKKIIFPAHERKYDTLVFLPDSQITAERMMTFANEVLGRMPKKTALPEVPVKKVISIEEMIDSLTERIKNSMKMSFKDFSGQARTREEKVIVIVGFLAILELVRQGIVNAIQEERDGDITIERYEEITTIE